MKKAKKNKLDFDVASNIKYYAQYFNLVSNKNLAYIL
jgi:hypothetical protein